MLIDAKSIAYHERGLSGIDLKGLFQRLEIAEALKSKTRDAPGGETVAKGEAEIGITQISEILSEVGAELAGPLPAEIQNYTVLAAAVGANATQADAAMALLKCLALREAASVMKAKGLEPPG
jgi:molybdate transport system substrate-binding protein